MSVLEHNEYIPEEQEQIGSKFLISNGYMGYRGTLDEATSSDFVALNINGLYDGHRFVENVNVFNPLYSMVKADGIDLNPRSFRPLNHTISLDTDNGIFKRQTEFKYGPTKIKINSERFLDQNNKSMMYSVFTFSSNNKIDIELFSGIDKHIWNINANHLRNLEETDEKNITIIKAKTKYNETDVTMGLYEVFSFNAKSKPYKNGIKKYEFSLEPKKVYTIHKYVCILHSEEDILNKTREKLLKAEEIGYKRHKSDNQTFWDEAFLQARVNVFNNDEVMDQMDYAVYQLIAHRPYSDKVSVNQKGLSGQYDMGAVSWNTEILLLPFYTNVFPDTARHMIKYRINSLEKAILKAESLGYEGAFYAEDSGPEGAELSLRNVTNNIHINGSIVYGLYQYIERTKDYSVLFEGGLEMLLECCNFYLSYTTLSENKKHFDFLNVSGLDDTHGSIDNEAYTNLIIKNCLDSMIKCVAFAKAEDKFRVKDIFLPKNYEKLISDVRSLRRKLYTKKENIDYLIESFDKYFNLEDRDVSTLKKLNFKSKVNFKDIENTTYQNNSNVIPVLALFLDEYSEKIKRMNFNYYMRRSMNPDIFTRIMLVIVACASDQSEEAYKQYIELADLDITNKYLFNKGLNLALLGGIYDMMVYGFAGLRHHVFLLSGEYNNVNKIRRLEFFVKIANNLASVKTKRNSVSISWNNKQQNGG